MNFNAMFSAAKAAGIEPFEIKVYQSSKVSASTFNDKVENYTAADSARMTVRGLVDGKSGVFTTDRVDDGVIDLAVAAVKDSAKYGNPAAPEFFIKGGDYEYDSTQNFSQALADAYNGVNVIELAQNITAAILKKDNRIESASSTVEYEQSENRMLNSNGLDVCHKRNSVAISAEIKAVMDGEVQSGFDYEFLFDGSFDVEKFATNIVKNSVDQFGGKNIESGKCSVVFEPTCVALLIDPLRAAFSAFEVDNHTSLLEGKDGKQVFSPLFTLEEAPLANAMFGMKFDSEGVPCVNKKLIDRGVVTGFVYDLETAKKHGKTSQGNGSLVGSNIRPGVGFVRVASGEKSLDEIMASVGDGVYITSIGGIGTGLNGKSGNFSLQAQGYEIKNGKRGAAISLMTIAGNIMDCFASVSMVGNDSKVTYAGVQTPSIAVDGISVTGVKD